METSCIDRREAWNDPFTSNGFTKYGDNVIPEYVAKNIPCSNR